MEKSEAFLLVFMKQKVACLLDDISILVFLWFCGVLYAGGRVDVPQRWIFNHREVNVKYLLADLDLRLSLGF